MATNEVGKRGGKMSPLTVILWILALWLLLNLVVALAVQGTEPNTNHICDALHGLNKQRCEERQRQYTTPSR
jgi:hypothetical protein